jgi:hypothetical protein
MKILSMLLLIPTITLADYSDQYKQQQEQRIQQQKQDQQYREQRSQEQLREARDRNIQQTYQLIPNRFAPKN